MSPESVPGGLAKLVEGALVPGTRLQRSGKSAIEDYWLFQLLWARQTFELKIPFEEWIDEQRELISLRARLGAPAPEATRGGRGLWIRFCEKRIASENFSYEFQLFRKPGDSPRVARVRVAVPSAVLFAQRAREVGREPHAYLMATVLWQLKDRLDAGRGSAEDKIRHTVSPDILPREPATDESIRAYVTQKLGHAYRIAGQSVSLVFDWTDLDYLGVSEDDFTRAINEQNRNDWVASGLELSPTSEFVERVDALLIGYGDSGG